MRRSPSPRHRRLSPAGHALLATVVALLLGSLLNAQALARTAAGLPFGAQRSIAIAVTSPLRAISSFLFLDRPRLALDALLDRAGGGDPEPVVESGPAATPPVTTTAVTAAGPDGVGLRRPTAVEPLRVWIIGDSLMELLGPSLVNVADDSGVIDAQVDFRFVSGLTRKDFFDWPAHATEQIPVLRPELIVVMFGGNDGQDAMVDGELLERWTPPWVEFYRKRVAEAMDVFGSGGASVYWIGLPVMQNETFSEHVEILNAVYREEAAKRPGVALIESWDTFTDEKGQYSAYLTNDDGRLELMRYGDGVHFTWAGARRLARVILQQITDDWSGPPDGR